MKGTRKLSWHDKKSPPTCGRWENTAMRQEVKKNTLSDVWEKEGSSFGPRNSRKIERKEGQHA